MLRQLGRDTLVYGVGDFAAKLIAFAAFPVLAAALSPAAFGSLELALTAVSLVGIVVNCGLNNAVQRFYWDPGIPPARQRAIVTSGMVSLAAFGSGAALAGLLLLPHLAERARGAGLALGAVGIAAALLSLPANQCLQYILDTIRLHLAPLRFLALSFASKTALALASVAAVWRGFGVDGILVSMAAVAILSLPAGLVLIRRDLELRFDRAVAAELVAFGRPFIFAGLAYWIFGSMDRWMLAWLSSVEETGIYSVANRFASVVMMLSLAFGQAWSPYAMKVRADFPDGYRAVYARVGLLLLFAMLALGGTLALFSGEILALVLPGEYAPAALPFAILSFGIAMQATQQVTAIGISLEKKTHLFARMAWTTALLNLAGNLVLIPRFGASGAACATFFSYLLLTAGYLRHTQALHPLPLPWRPILRTLAAGCAIAAVAFAWRETRIDPAVVCMKLAVAGILLAAGWPGGPAQGMNGKDGAPRP